jgi:DNA polymerase-4
MAGATRHILHVDMDAFYAAVEQLDYPELRGKPILVGGDGPRSVVTTASYEARPFGCHSAQPMVVAKRLCPQAVIVRPRFSRYREVSNRMFEILESFTPQIEPISIDEAFLDLTGSERLLGGADDVARRIKQRVRDQLGLTISVGVAPNKFLAKLASDLEKPDGLTIIRADDVDRVLPPLPVTKIWGIGPKTAARLLNLGIKTIADIRRLPADVLPRTFGSEASRYYNLAHGIDDRPVVRDGEAKSISHEETFGADLANPDEVRNVLLGQVEQVAWRLRKHGLRARNVYLKIRDGSFRTVTRAAMLREATDQTKLLWETSRELFDLWAVGSFKPVRLIGMGAAALTNEPEQLGLFRDRKAEQQKQIDRAVDGIKAKFGGSAIRRGPASLQPPSDDES